MLPIMPVRSRLKRRSRSYAYGSCWIRRGKICGTLSHGSVPLKRVRPRSRAVLTPCSKPADEKVKAAEERARVAEEWLTRVYDTIASEFAIEPAAKQIA